MWFTEPIITRNEKGTFLNITARPVNDADVLKRAVEIVRTTKTYRSASREQLDAAIQKLRRDCR